MGLILLHSSSLAEPATRKPPKRKASASAGVKASRPGKRRSLYQGYDVQGRGEGRQIPWATLHVAYDRCGAHTAKVYSDCSECNNAKG